MADRFYVYSLSARDHYIRDRETLKWLGDNGWGLAIDAHRYSFKNIAQQYADTLNKELESTMKIEVHADDDWFDDDEDFELDEYEEYEANCSLFRAGDVWLCMQVGSEYCDWDCPFHNEIGDPVEEYEED